MDLNLQEHDTPNILTPIMYFNNVFDFFIEALRTREIQYKSIKV